MALDSAYLFVGALVLFTFIMIQWEESSRRMEKQFNESSRETMQAVLTLFLRRFSREHREYTPWQAAKVTAGMEALEQ